MQKAYSVLEATSAFLHRVQVTLAGTACVLAIPACYALRWEMDAPIKGVGMMFLAAVALLVPIAMIYVAQIALLGSEPWRRLPKSSAYRVSVPHDIVH